MKKIIDKRKYDTATAEKVAQWGSGVNYTDFAHYEEVMYRTSQGRWFLHVEGGLLSPVAVGSGRMLRGCSMSIGERKCPRERESTHG